MYCCHCMSFGLVFLLWGHGNRVLSNDNRKASQDEVMELLVENIVNKEALHRESGTLGNASEWCGTVLDSSGDVIEIDWTRFDLQGSFSFDRLPVTITQFSCDSNTLSGTLHGIILSPNVAHLNLSRNDFCGHFDTDCFPEGLTALCLYQNRFGGVLNFTHLPGRLTVLNLGRNFFASNVNLTRLPPALEFLDISESNFHGTLDLTQLPSSLEELYLDQNGFEGKAFFEGLPDRMRILDISCTRFVGEAYVRRANIRIRSEFSQVTVRILEKHDANKETYGRLGTEPPS